MLDCPRCGRRVPEVLGASEQVCPRCGAYIVTRPGAAASALPPSPAPAPAAAPAPARALATEPRRADDPAGAVATGLALYRKHLPRLALAWLPVLALDLALSLGLLAWRNANGLLDDGAELDVQTGVRLLGVFLPPYLLLWALKLATWSLAVPLAVAALDGQRPAPLTAWRALRARLPVVAPLAGALVVLDLAGALLAAVPFAIFYYAAGRVTVGLLALLVALTLPLTLPLLLFLHSYLYAPAAAMREGETVAGALAASRALARNRKPMGFTAAILTTVLAAFLAALAASAAARALTARLAPAWHLVAEEAAASTVAWLLAPLAAMMVATYWIAATRAGPPRAPAAPARDPERAPTTQPAPVAPTRNTKCPGCSTVFPFHPALDGGAVRVACPACGRAGVVR